MRPEVKKVLQDLVREIRSSDPDPARFDYRILEKAEEFLSREDAREKG
jgi:hypothetical protein